MTTEPKGSPTSDNGDEYYEVPEAEVKAWADRERRRRRAWVDGPSEEEKRAWAARHHRKRQLDLADEAGPDADLAEGRRVLDRLQLDTALALVGAASLLAEAPYRLVGNLVRAGRDWEDDTLATLQRRRRVRMNDED